MPVGEIVDFFYRFSSFNFLIVDFYLFIYLQYYLQYILLTILKLTTPLITFSEIRVTTTRFTVTVLTKLTLSTIPRVHFQQRGSPHINALFWVSVVAYESSLCYCTII